MELNYPEVKQPCQCENNAHFDIKKTTPMGRKAHKYGHTTSAITAIKTPYGTFRVCTDCLNDCQKGTVDE